MVEVSMVERVARALTDSGDLPSAHKRLLLEMSNRWIKGTGFVHRSVVRDLIAWGLVDHRIHRGEQQIRSLRAALLDSPIEKDTPDGIR